MLKKPKMIIPLLLSFLIFTPYLVNAHVKWFTTVEPEKVAIQDIITPFFLMIALLAALIVAVLPFVITKMEEWQWAQKFERKLQSYSKYSEYLLKYGTAIALIIQVVSGNIFALEFSAQTQGVVWVIWGIIFALLIPNKITTQIGAIGIIGLFTWVTLNNGPERTIDYIFYVAIAIGLFLYKNQSKRWYIPILYFVTGFSLCWVAMEKLIYPSMATDVVVKHGVPTFGFSPEIFVLLCAFIEFVIGYLLFIGILNRTLAVVTTLVFMSTTLIFGVPEIIGHFMLHVVFIIFFIEGTNHYSMPIKICQTNIQRAICIFINFFFGLFTTFILYYVLVNI